ncbi:4Fe-4S dicluster domain-containing protein [Candidatus Kryptonium thompsonii]|uniref:4Fe-4S dicluster domain-containing protein n=1 Tax=Candidatus Kryptonium thompsonii TaxID=1633631 RepID=A0A0P1LHG6_9BACT|nr:4Fe-4S dicluster domain-containing protein [Candidatus Kryptonium thompsoni]CUS80812.1 4Fe-4S dicluster domain-containing protein [Candidatus Kryptonium thompsoni]CUS84125.1 4Fe-4S dicluster domain-containing protein [Candidatus Kryptonium thompsoni]CUS84486.1 4Fe-4S dicluster domain-containing protein [Candidatus Kryptonium thompsoni]CUS86256.1 4Fe-4S dicluster domain-containing protein [Candidatus Kryptonium thompsoni]CUS92122.1 4Fe-4S dicluster domain-containing protein [Candidatus Krypt
MEKFKSYYLAPEELNKIFDYFKTRGYKIAGPTVKDNAIVYDEIESVNDLPLGWTDEQGPGSYRLKRRNDEALFGYVVGPHSWKKFLFPPILTLWEAKRENGKFKIYEQNYSEEKFVFVGVRACEISAILIQDKIFGGGQYVDPNYLRRRENAFIIAVNCNEPGNNCFCLSTGTGPKVLTGYDIVLTEVISESGHYLIAKPGSDLGEEILASLGFREATTQEIDEADKVSNEAVNKFRKEVDLSDVVEMLQSNYENPLWEKVSEKCLTCANCTMVCPTCFCHTVEDVTDLTGQSAKRVRKWDSCFTLEFSYIHGGSVRYSTASRYRQWMTHKLSTWKNQFGMIGCVGCGRCITWCPVGIDIVENVKLFKESELKLKTGESYGRGNT